MNKRDFIDTLTRDICELSDRTSPEDYPDHMLVTGKELDGLASNLLEETIFMPDTITPPIRDALGVMNFQTGPIAHALRADGHDIKTKCEDEQAYVLFWFLKLAIEHGDGWRGKVGDELKRIASYRNPTGLAAQAAV